MVDQNTNGITTLFFRNPYILLITICLILAAGVSSVISLPRLEDPRIVNRNPLIITPVPGASAMRIETLVTEVIEESLQEIAEIKSVESTTRSGVSIILVELDGSVDGSTNQEVFSEIRDKVNSVRHKLPSDALDPIIDDKRDPAGFTEIIALSWNSVDSSGLGILDRIAEALSDRLRIINGTELVRIYGKPQEEITVTLDPADLVDLGLTLDDIAQLISAADSKTTAGVMRGSQSDILIEVLGELDSLQRIAAIPIPVNSQYSVVRIGDIAEVKRGWKSPASDIARVDSKRAILIAARMDESRRIDQWAQEVNEVVADFSKTAGQSVQIERIFQQERYTSKQLDELVDNLTIGASVVVAVIFVLMGWRLALIIGLALPLVVSLVLLGLQWSGGAIHQMSIYGIVIALGLLIDNAIVVADQVSRNKSEGSNAGQAVEQAIRHLFFPLLASTLTTILAFLPILLLPGNVGDFVRSIGSSVVMALIASFVIAMTVIAGLAGLFARPEQINGQRFFWKNGFRSQRLVNVYRHSLQSALNRPLKTLSLSVLLPVGGFIAAGFMGNEFFPSVDRDMFTVELWMQSDSSVHNTLRQVDRVDEEIRSFRQIEHSYWMVGNSFPTVYYNLIMNKDKLPHYAQGIVVADSNRAAKQLIPRLQRRLDEKFPGAQIVVSQFGQGPPVVADIEYRIFGPDLAVTQSIGEKLRVMLQAHPDVLHTQTTMPHGEPKLWFDADEDEARLAGFSTSQLAQILNASLEGKTGGSVIENLENLPVRVRLDDSYRSNLNRIASIPLPRGKHFEWLPLAAIGEFKLRPELGGITRHDTERANIVKGYTRIGALPIEVTRKVLEQFQSVEKLPDGYRIEFGGAVEQDQEAMAGLITYLPIIVVLTAATLILAFNSATLALLLTAVAVLSIGPGLLATWAAGLPISFNTILGTLGLVGLAFNNSIVVLAAIQADSKAKPGDPNALVRPVSSTTRHLISTTLTTIGGFLPLILIVGGDFWPSLAIVLAGGVGGSLLLALYFVPAAYVLLNPHDRAMQPDSDRLRAKPRQAGLTVTVVSIIALLSSMGCTVGPDYRAPEAEIPERFASQTNENSIYHISDAEPSLEWWQQFGGPMLSQLIDTAIKRNHDIGFALAELRATRFMRQGIKSKLYPQIGLGGSYQRRRASENGPINLQTLSNAGLAKVESNLFDVGFDASWELDIFGGIQRSIEASDADVDVVLESQHSVVLSVIAEVARNYIELRGNQRRLDIVKNSASIQSATFDLVRRKMNAGLAAEIDTSRAAAQLATTTARIPPIQATIKAAAHRLAVLTGRHPTALVKRLLEPQRLSTPPNVIPIGLPSELLRRRPDVRQAERQLAAASARVGQATADLYPRFFLVGFAGLESISAGDLFTASSRAWSLGPTIRWPVFQGGRIRANIAANEARFESAYARFQQAVLLATEDVETTLVRFSQQHKQVDSLKSAERHSQRAVELAQVLYDKGLKDFLTVLDAERVLTEVRDNLIQSETSVMLQLIQLYKALGGGWQGYTTAQQ